MELTEKDRKIIVDLASIAWQAGAIRSPQQAQEVQDLVRRIATPPEKPKGEGTPEKKEG